MDIIELLKIAHEKKTSDLHLSPGLPPKIRVDGDVNGFTGIKWG